MKSNNLNSRLPKDLFECEIQIQIAINESSRINNNLYNTINLKFEGFKINDSLFRILEKISTDSNSFIIAFSDYGSSALCKRDYPKFKDIIFTFKELILSNNIESSKTIIAVSPQPYDYDEFEELTQTTNNKIIMFNGKLEETTIGIGLVARERRIKFIKQWKNIYWLEPFPKGALLYIFNNQWLLFKLYSDGNRLHKSYQQKPDKEELDKVFD